MVLKSLGSKICYGYSCVFGSSLEPTIPIKWIWDPPLVSQLDQLFHQIDFMPLNIPKSDLTLKYISAWLQTTHTCNIIIISKTQQNTSLKHSQKGSTIEPIIHQSKVITIIPLDYYTQIYTFKIIFIFLAQKVKLCYYRLSSIHQIAQIN